MFFFYKGGVIICRGRRYDFFAPLLKQKTSNFRETIHFRGIVPIQFLIKLRLSLKWALGESSQTKFTFLCRWPSWMLVPDVKCTLVLDQHLNVFFMSRVPLTQFRLFRTKCFIRVQGLTATPGLTWPQDEIRTKIEKKTFARWIIYNSQLLAQMKLENAILSLKLTLILT